MEPSLVNDMAGSFRPADIGNLMDCSVCGETYEKVMPGVNICGTCQVQIIIIQVHQQRQYMRWGVLPVNG